MNRSIFLATSILANLSCLAMAQTHEQTQQQTRPARPNIVFIFSDDHAVQAIGAYGSTINQTPNLDRLAASGMLFERSFCGNSICGPSRATILTGKHSHLNGFRRNGDRFDGSQTTFPKLLQHAGYQTALIGKWHLASDPTGFDFWQILPGQGNYYNPDFITAEGRQRHEGYCSDLITQHALDWLDTQRHENRPFLLMVQHKAPHRNWSPALRHLGRYPIGSIPVPSTLRDDYSGRSQLLQENEMTLARHFHWRLDLKFKEASPDATRFIDGMANGEYQRMSDAQREAWDAHYDPENARFIEQLAAAELNDDEILNWKHGRYMHDYLGSVQAVDDSVGAILDYLDQHGLSENTIVVYSSDQGFYLGEHGWYDKRWMFEESLKMPLLIKWPQVVAANSRCQALVQNIDYGPTLLDAAGVEIPTEMQGRSLLPLLRHAGAAPSDWRDAVYYQYWENDAVHEVPVHDGVRTDRYKLMYFPKSNEWQLFDLVADPHELKSIHGDPAAGPILAGLQRRYQNLKDFYRVNTAVIPVSRGDEGWWKSRQREVLQKAQNTNPQVIWIGDSITQGWESAGAEVWNERIAPLECLNLGFSGDRTEHVLWRLDQLPWERLNPRAAVIMIGTNNTGHRMQRPQEVAAGIQAIVERLQDRKPAMKILLLGVFPRGADRWDAGRLNNIAINDGIRSLGDEHSVFFRDLSAQFLEADQTLSKDVMPDYLHLSGEGYRRWADAVVPILESWDIGK